MPKRDGPRRQQGLAVAVAEGAAGFMVAVCFAARCGRKLEGILTNI
jgi:hypothetical protein